MWNDLCESQGAVRGTYSSTVLPLEVTMVPQQHREISHPSVVRKPAYCSECGGKITGDSHPQGPCSRSSTSRPTCHTTFANRHDLANVGHRIIFLLCNADILSCHHSTYRARCRAAHVVSVYRVNRHWKTTIGCLNPTRDAILADKLSWIQLHIQRYRNLQDLPGIMFLNDPS